MPSTGTRHYGLDWLRIGAFALLILHHVGMAFVPGTWLVKVPDPVEAVAWPMIVIQPWRMPLLFAVSGYASWQLLARSPDRIAFLGARSYRLLLPVLFGMAVITPPQFWVALVQFHDYHFGLAHFWRHDWFSFARIGGLQLPAMAHLWFLTYLWTYTTVVTIAVALGGPTLRRMAASLIDRLGDGAALFWAPLAFLLPLRLALLFTVPETSGLLHDWVSDVNFIPAFLLGLALAARPSLWTSVHRSIRPAAIAAVAACALLLAIEYVFGDRHGHAVQAADRGAQFVLSWSATLLWLAAADRFANRDHPVRRRLNEAVFPLYIAHQTVTVLAAWWLIPLGLNYWLLALAITAATVAGSFAFYWLALRTGPLRPFLGLAPTRPRRCSAALDLAPAG
jgi:surface polysaccharide O-acyltransferase-like enzyme